MKTKILVLVALAGAVSGCNETHGRRINTMQPVSYSFNEEIAEPFAYNGYNQARRPVRKLYRGGGKRKASRKRTLYRPNSARSKSGLLRYVSIESGTRISCLPSRLKGMLENISNRFGRKVTINSGHRSKRRNRRVGGVKNSYHLTCQAVDIKVAGVSKRTLARYVRALPGSGGVGTYCGKNIVHLDVGPRRSWNYHCRGWRRGRYAKK